MECDRFAEEQIGGFREEQWASRETEDHLV